MASPSVAGIGGVRTVAIDPRRQARPSMGEIPRRLDAMPGRLEVHSRDVLHGLLFLVMAGLAAAPAEVHARARDGAAVEVPVKATVELRWRGPDGCPDRAWGRARVEGFLGRTMDAAARERLRFDVVLRAGAAGFEVHVHTTSSLGESRRELSDADCAVLADAVAFIVASTIDPDVVHVEPGPIPGTEGGADRTETAARPGSRGEQGARHVEGAEPGIPEPEPEPAVEPPVDPPVDRAEKRATVRPRPGLGIRLDGVGALGPLPSFAGGVSGGAALIVNPMIRVEIAGSYLFARQARVPGDRSVGGDISLAAATLRSCVTPGGASFVVPLCGGLQVGAMVGDPVGTDLQDRVRLPWLAAEVGVGLAWRVSARLWIWLESDLVVPLVRPRFVVVPAGPAHEAAPLGMRAVVGVEMRIL